MGETKAAFTLRYLLTILSSVLLTPNVAHTQVPGSLLVNGSFEQGPALRGFLNLAAGNTSIPGWVVTGEGIDYVGSDYWISSDGQRAIDLDGSVRSRTTPPYVSGGIAQTFPTKPRIRYRVTFDLAGNPNQLPRVKRFRISAAGQSAELSFDATGKNARSMGWQKTTWTFTAKDATTTLEFRSLTVSPQTGYSAAIDNVSVGADDKDVEPVTLLQVNETAGEIQVRLGSEVLFDTGKFELKAEATEALRGLVALLEKYPGAPFTIEGHTDSVGSAQSNQVLSENRANAVKQWLVESGVPSGRISTKGFGSTVPVATNETPEGRQRNRRVEVRVQR